MNSATTQYPLFVRTVIKTMVSHTLLFCMLHPSYLLCYHTSKAVLVAILLDVSIKLIALLLHVLLLSGVARPSQLPGLSEVITRAVSISQTTQFLHYAYESDKTQNE